MDTCNDLGLPGVSFAFSSIKSVQVPSVACCRETTASNIAAITSEATTHSTAPGRRIKGGKERQHSLPPGLPTTATHHKLRLGRWAVTLKAFSFGWGDKAFGRKSFRPASRKVHPASIPRLHWHERTGFLPGRELCFLQHLSDSKDPLAFYQTPKSQRTVTAQDFKTKKKSQPLPLCTQ